MSVSLFSGTGARYADKSILVRSLGCIQMSIFSETTQPNLRVEKWIINPLRLVPPRGTLTFPLGSIEIAVREQCGTVIRSQESAGNCITLQTRYLMTFAWQTKASQLLPCWVGEARWKNSRKAFSKRKESLSRSCDGIRRGVYSGYELDLR